MATSSSQAEGSLGSMCISTPATHSGTGFILLSPSTDLYPLYHLINSELGLHAVFLPPESSSSLSKHWFTPETLAFPDTLNLVALSPPTEHRGSHRLFCMALPACHFLIISACEYMGIHQAQPYPLSAAHHQPWCT